MEIRLARKEELSELMAFYNDIIDQQAHDDYSPRWTRDIYPALSDLQRFLDLNCLYLVKNNDQIIAAAALAQGEEEMYRQADWQKKVSDDEIAMLHLFAIKKDYRRTGLSDRFLDYLLNEARRYARVVHLDVMLGNVPAARLYLKHGFTYCQTMEIFYEDTGRVECDLYECDLEK